MPAEPTGVEDAELREALVRQIRRLFIHNGRDVDDGEVHLHLRHLAPLRVTLTGSDKTCRFCCWSFARDDADSVLTLLDAADALEAGPLLIDRTSENLRVWRFVPPDTRYRKARRYAQFLFSEANVEPEVWPLKDGQGEMFLPLGPPQNGPVPRLMRVSQGTDSIVARELMPVNNEMALEMLETVVPTVPALERPKPLPPITPPLPPLAVPLTRREMAPKKWHEINHYKAAVERLMSPKGDLAHAWEELPCWLCEKPGMRCPCPMHQREHQLGTVHFKKDEDGVWLCLNCFREHVLKGVTTKTDTRPSE
tara:strand:- start:137 stop:1063 length:927 start_codon:yes stop_codon:yes gene_type:complete